MIFIREYLFISPKYEIEQISYTTGENDMRILINRKAVSTLILIILLLCFMVFGALISYLWVMANYYNMPENTTLLIVTDVAFPVNNATYFNVTILNPSNSVSDVNITAIQLSAEERSEVYNVTTTEPPEQLPFLIRRGTTQTFKCVKNWGNFAGETVRIEPVAGNVSTKSFSYTTPKVKLNLTPNFDVTESIESFNLTVENSAESVINLTISEVMMFGLAINTTPMLPYILSPNQTKIFRCERNWEDLRGINATINVRTEEGYEATYATNELPGAILYIGEIKFDYADTSYFNLTISSSEQSTATAILDKVDLTLPDNTTMTVNTSPPLNITNIYVDINQSLTIKCFWNWNEQRNKTIIVTVYTKQGFTLPTKTETTPLTVVWDITDVKFDLDYTEHFSVNVTNMPCSLNEINITSVLLNENVTIMDPPFGVLTNGTQVMFNCSLPWGQLIGENVTVTVLTEDGLNISRIIAISSVGLKMLDKPTTGELLVPDLNITVQYVNITVWNSNNSLNDVTITKIVFETENKTYEIDDTLTYPKLSPDGYVLKTGENVTIICLWNWSLQLDLLLKVTIYTAEGFQVSDTWNAPFTP